MAQGMSKMRQDCVSCKAAKQSVTKRLYISDSTGKNPIAAGDFAWIFACICKSTAQIHYKKDNGK